MAHAVRALNDGGGKPCRTYCPLLGIHSLRFVSTHTGENIIMCQIFFFNPQFCQPAVQNVIRATSAFH